MLIYWFHYIWKSDNNRSRWSLRWRHNAFPFHEQLWLGYGHILFALWFYKCHCFQHCRYMVLILTTVPSGQVVILTIWAPKARENTWDSANVEKRGPSIVTVVPLEWCETPVATIDSMIISRSFSSNAGLEGRCMTLSMSIQFILVTIRGFTTHGLHDCILVMSAWATGIHGCPHMCIKTSLSHVNVVR